MNRDPEWCITQMKSIVQTFLQGKQLAGGISAGLHTATIAAVVFFLLFAVTAFLLVVAVYMYKREKKKRHSLNNSTLDPLKPATD